MRRFPKNKKAIGIIAAIIVMLLVSVMGTIVLSLFTGQSSSSLNYMHSQQAFFIAESGLQYYLEQLRNDSSWDTLPPQPSDEALGEGTFTITAVAIDTNSVDVTSRSQLTGQDGQIVTRVVQVSVSRAVYQALDYVVFSSGNVQFRGSSGTITGDIGSNKNILKTNGFTINGQLFPNLTIPKISPDITIYQPLADYIEVSGFIFANGQAYNGVYYISGDTTIESNVTINGSIIAEGNVVFDESNNLIISSLSGYPAIFSGNNISGQDSGAQIDGLIYANRDISLSTLNSAIIINGIMIAEKSFSFIGSSDVTLTYDSEILNNIPPGFGSASMQATDWDEVY